MQRLLGWAKECRGGGNADRVGQGGINGYEARRNVQFWGCREGGCVVGMALKGWPGAHLVH